MLLALVLALISPSVDPPSRLQGTQEAQQLSWRDVELGPGLVLDLKTGRLRSGARGEWACVGWDGDELWAQPSLARWHWSGGGPVSIRVARGGGEVQEPATAEMGAEYLYDLGSDGWGYLRVLAVEQDGVRLELARATQTSALERVPSTLSVAPEPSGHRLHWPAQEGEDYLVRRRRVGSDEVDLVMRVKGGNWLDDSAPPGALLEYRVALASRDAFGARKRAVRQVHPGGWPLSLRVGQTLNLLSGQTGGSGAHLEVTYVSPDQVAWRVIGGAQLTAIKGNGSELPWQVPSVNDGGYSTRLARMQPATEMAFHLPAEDIYGRLQLVQAKGQDPALLRQIDLGGGRMLPRPPRLEGASEWSNGMLSIKLARPPSLSPGLTIAVELEAEYLSESWVEVGVFAAESSKFAIPMDAALGRVIRVRSRHRLGTGVQSLASIPEACLLLDRASPLEVEQALDSALADLGHPGFLRRRQARGVLSLLGPLAWPRLKVALTGGDAEVAASCRELLLDAEGDREEHLELVLRSRATEIGVQSEPPAGLFDPEPGERAQILLESWAQNPTWVRVLAMDDPDPTVREMAQLMIEAPDLPPLLIGSPRVLLGLGRSEQSLEDWSELSLEHGPGGLASILRERSISDDVAADLVRLRLASELDSQGRKNWLGPGGGAECAELVLRLLDHFALSGKRALLRAAEVLVSGPGATLEAQRELLDLRLGAEEPSPGSRMRVVLDQADLGLLEARLGSLFEAGERDVDVVLPAGTYRSHTEDGHWLDVRLPGLRLVAEGEVRIEAGLRVQDVSGVVLQGIDLVHTSAAAMLLIDASVIAQGCTFAGSQSVITLQGSDLELDRCRVAPLHEIPGIYSLRFSGGSSLRARATRMYAGTLYLGDRGQAYLDRCVLEAGSRALIQAQQNGILVVRDSLLTGTGTGIYGLEEGLLEGVVVKAGQDPLGQGKASVHYCAEHTHASGGGRGRSTAGAAISICPVRAAQRR